MRDMDEVSHVQLLVFHKRQLLCQLKSSRSCFGKQLFGPNDLFSLILWDKLRLIDGRRWSMALHLFEGRSWVADDWHSTTWCGFPQRWPLTPRCLARTNTRTNGATFHISFFNKSQLLPIKPFCLWHTAVLFDNRSHEAMLYRCHGLLFDIASGQVMSPHQSNVPKVKSIFEGAFLIYLSFEVEESILRAPRRRSSAAF